MAKLIPARSSCLSSMTSGEKRLSERIEEKLDDEYLCWYNVAVGAKGLRPDFVVVHPARGVLVLEVKDWKLDTIVPDGIDRHSIQLYTNRGLVTEKNPLSQARVYALEIAVALESDPLLRNPQGHRFAGKLVAPYGWGAVLSSITRAQFDASGLAHVIDASRVICKDEMVESIDGVEFQERLWGMFTQVFPCKLAPPQLDRIRYHLFPEIRVNTNVNQFGLFDENPKTPKSVAIPDLIRVMDLNQEQLARSMGDGHRIIHGVAGSGKTMILAYRCVHLAKALAKPILVICFNVTLGARLKQTMEAHKVSDKVTVLHFHDWCKDRLTKFKLPKPKWSKDINAYSKDLVDRTIAAVTDGRISPGEYGAVLIDEGHDFDPEWYKLLVKMVDPDTNSMLVLYDDAQAIYTKRERRSFSFSSVGIQARGRTTILKVNYRNTLDILSVARGFADTLINPEDAEEDGIPLIAPESAGRRGPIPEFVRLKNRQEEAKLIVERIVDAINQGRSPSDIAVVYRRDFHVSAITEQLEKKEIKFRIANDQDNKRALFEGDPSVKLLSMHSSKGLEFHTVFIPGVGHMPLEKEPEDDEARILYVAMTRATDCLILTTCTESFFTARLEQAIHGLDLN